MDNTYVPSMRRVRLELARDPEHPVGSRSRGYDFIAPLDDKGHIIAEDWKRVRGRCRVKRFWAGEPDQIGHIVRKRGGRGRSTTISTAIPRATNPAIGSARTRSCRDTCPSEHDGVLRTFKVMSVRELD